MKLLTFTNICRGIALFSIIAVASGLSVVCADGFDDPKVPVEATVCFLGMFVFPLCSAVVMAKLVKKWNKEKKIEPINS